MRILIIGKKAAITCRFLAVVAVLAVLGVAAWGLGPGDVQVWAEKADDAGSQGVQAAPVPTVKADSVQKQAGMTKETAEASDKLLGAIKELTDKTDSRTLYIKILVRQLTRLATAAVILLLVIVFTIPVAVWLLGRSKLLGLPADVAATLISVEERQAKLVSTFKEIQDEMEVLHFQSGPDLKNLMKSAQEYLTQNERALGTGSASSRPKG